jgi:hypothetical protein
MMTRQQTQRYVLAKNQSISMIFEVQLNLVEQPDDGLIISLVISLFSESSIVRADWSARYSGKISILPGLQLFRKI